MRCNQCGFDSDHRTGSDRGKKAGHIRLLGILWLSLSAMRVLPGLILAVAAAYPVLTQQMPGMLVLGLQAVVVGLWINLFAGAIAGWGLLTHQPWAPTAALIVAVLNLWDLLYGAPLGIYTLWTLLPEPEPETGQHASYAPARPAEHSPVMPGVC